MSMQPPMDGAMVAGGPPAAVPASIGGRIVAYLIDWLVQVAIFLPLFIIVGIGFVINEGLGLLLYLVAALVVFALSLWIWVWHQGETGQTPGKRKHGLMLVDRSTGAPIGGGKGIARWLLQAVLGGFCFIGYLWAIFDKDNQTLYDKILDSHVVQVPPGEVTPIFPGGRPF